MKFRTVFAAVVAALCVCAVAEPIEYFVDGNRPDDSGGDDNGTSIDTAYRTIQAAIDKAAAGDIVTVLPGEYGDSQGIADTLSDSAKGTSVGTRLKISKNITLRSLRGADVTHIVGKRANTANGMGSGAVRCLTASSCRIEGFTIRDGATDSGNESDPVRGGGVLASSPDVVLTDCVISNCVGTRGGGAYMGTYVRCRFIGNSASNYGCAMRQASAFNCLFTGNAPCPGAANSTPGTIAYPGAVVNCTIVNNNDYAINTTSSAWPGPVVNSLMLFNSSGAVYGIADYASFTNCVSDNATMANQGVECRRAKAPQDELFSPASYDYRLMPGSLGVGAGSLSAARSRFEAYMDGKDLAGDPCHDAASGTINVGAFQSPAPAEASSMAMLYIAVDATKGFFTVNGRQLYATQPYRTGEWPHAVCVGFKTRGDFGIICYSRSDSALPDWPTEKDEVWMLMPKTGSVTTAQHTGVLRYVDAGNAGDALADGTAAHPYPNIIDATTNISEQTVIMVADGEYREGGKFAAGATNRVWLSGAKWQRLRSVNGAGRTFIFGAAGSDANGLGADAVRCVYAAGLAQVQGFTLLDGRSNEGVGDGDAMRGGGVYADISGKGGGQYNDETVCIADCVISNCVASRGAALFGGKAERCLITKNRATVSGITRNCWLVTSLVTGNDDSAGKGIVGVLTSTFQSTVAANAASSGAAAFQETAAGQHCNSLYSSIVAGTAGGPDIQSNKPFVTNSVIGVSFAGRTATMSADTAIADPQFSNAAEGDFRVLYTSPAANLGDPAYLKSAIDYTGRPYSFGPDGRYPVGAFAQVVGGVMAGATNAVSGGISPSGFIQCQEPVELTFTATDAGTRNFLGFEVGGEFHADDGSGTITVAADGSTTIPVTAVYDNNWYVDAVNGNDENTGYSWAKARKTLAAAVAQMIAGDVLNVAPGAYAKGEMLQTYTKTPLFGPVSAAPALKARIVVPEGCSLVSRDGPECTFIVGEADKNGDANGLGPNAVRGVYLCPNARISGFTVTGGHTDTGTENFDTSGGGIAGYDFTSVVENCIVSNNVSQRGGGMRWGTCRGCRILANVATANATALRNVKATSCLIDGNRGPVVMVDCFLYSCTVGKGNVAANGGMLDQMTWTLTPSSNYAFVNTVMGAPANRIEAAVMSNCAYRAGITIYSRLADASVVNVNPVAGDVMLDDNGRPQKGSVAIDAGDASLLPGSETGTDLAGVQRVYNNALDIGCYEYDARGDFAHALNPGGGVAVTAASPAVELAAEGVCIRNGELAATWSRSGTRGRYTVDCAVTGGGQLTVLLNDEPVAELTAASGARTIELPNMLAENALVFRYSASDGDTGGAFVSHVACRRGTVVNLR